MICENIDAKISSFVSGDLVCKNDYDRSVVVIRDAYTSLTDLIKYSTFGNVNQLKQDVINSCNQALTCSQATKILLDLLNGRRGEDCDLLSNLYERDLTYKQYRGLKNNFLSAVTYVYQLTSLGMGLQAASLSLQTNDPQQWL